MRAARTRLALAVLLVLGGTIALAFGAPAEAKKKEKKPKGGKSAASQTAAPGETVLVWIGEDKITPATVQARLDELPEQVKSTFASPEGKQRLLERIVEERVWLAAAQKKGVQDRAEIKRQLDQQRRDLLVRTYVNEIMAANPAPSDSEARAWYDSHLQDYQLPATVTLSHIQTRTETSARRVKQYARAGQDWKKLAATHSTDSLTRNNGGALGSATREGVFGSIGAQPAIAETAFAIGAGKIGGPIKTSRGWHVIKVDAVKEASVRPFEQVRGGIVRQLGGQRQQEFYNAKLGEIRGELRVAPDSVAIKSYVSQRKGAREMFNEAQNAGPPMARIEAYRQMLEIHPDSEVSPQARFMIGFIQSEELKDYDAAERTFKELLQRHPGSELAASAQWMVDHMRTEGAPSFMNLEADSGAAPAGEPRDDEKTAGNKGTSSKP
jgi:peptidyl-prolyl cis-trans isomerase C